MSGAGQTFTVSLFVDPLIDEFGWSRTTISGLYTAGSLTAASSMLAIGWLLDRFGARVVLAGVGLMLGLAALWMSEVSNQLGVYAGFTALRMFGQGSLGLVPSSLVALWFVRKRGRATALAGLGMEPGYFPAAHPYAKHADRLATDVGGAGDHRMGSADPRRGSVHPAYAGVSGALA